MSPELQPKAVQYYCHMSSSVSQDQYTALPRVSSGHVIRTYNYIYNVFVQFYVNFSRQEHQMYL